MGGRGRCPKLKAIEADLDGEGICGGRGRCPKLKAIEADLDGEGICGGRGRCPKLKGIEADLDGEGICGRQRMVFAAMVGDTYKVGNEISPEPWLAAVLAVAAACIIVAAITYIKSKRTMRKLEKMVQKVMDGDFSEGSFDETELSRLEAEMAKFLENSRLSSKNIEEEHLHVKSLISDISHQTKTPIANIMLYSELLGERKLPEESLEFVSQIKSQAEKLDFLIKALLKTSRLESGLIAVKPEPQCVYPVVMRAVEAVLPKAEMKRIEVEFVSDSTVKLDAKYPDGNSDASPGSSDDEAVEHAAGAAVFDAKWTEEAIYNILDNAVKYTCENGRVAVKITDYALFCCVSIEDNGIGISEDEQPKIFARFYRSPSVAEKEGVGIGLYLARKIITSEGGYIRVKSEVGKGTEFGVYLKKNGV